MDTEDVETCPRHPELLALAKDTNTIVSKINVKLMGTYDNPGLLSEINDLKKFQKSYDDTKALEKIKEVDKRFRFISRIIYWLCGIIGAGVLANATDAVNLLSKAIQK